MAGPPGRSGGEAAPAAPTLERLPRHPPGLAKTGLRAVPALEIRHQGPPFGLAAKLPAGTVNGRCRYNCRHRKSSDHGEWTGRISRVRADRIKTNAERRDLIGYVVMLAEVMHSVMLYAMFRSHEPVLALSVPAARLTLVAVMAAMQLPQAGFLAFATHVKQFIALDADQRAEFAWVLRHIHDLGVLVWQVFFTLHFWLFGVLAWRSDPVPRLLAVGILIGGTGYLAASVRTFQFPQDFALEIAVMALLALATLAEIGFAVWLLVRGQIHANAAGASGQTLDGAP